MPATLLQEPLEQLHGHAGLGLWPGGSEWRTGPHMNAPYDENGREFLGGFSLLQNVLISCTR